MRRTHLAVLLALALALALILVGCGGSQDTGSETPTTPVQQQSADAKANESAEALEEDHTPIARPSTNGALHVEGTSLVDEHGSMVVLRGVSTHGLAWFPAYVNQDMFEQLASWGANAVRLALYTEEYGGWCAGGDRAALRQLVLDGVRFARKADLYVIVDWHTLSDNDPTTHQDEAIAFFKDISSELGDDPHVIYEVCNEPNGATSWASVRNYAEAVIPVIRDNAPHALCLVGTPEWCQRPDEAAADPLSISNVMYTVHFYAATHKQDLRDRTEDALKTGLPVFVSEFGICDASGNGAIDEGEANEWMALLDRLGISRMMWNLSNKDESSAMVKNACTKTSDLADDDLSQAGLWLKTMLGGEVTTSEAPAEGSGAEEGEPSPSAIPGGQFEYQARLINSWQDGGKTVYQYELSFTNKGSDVSSWEITVPFSGEIEVVDGWNGTYEAIGHSLRIGNAEYNGTLAAGATLGEIGFQVKGSQDLKIVP